MTLKEQFAEAVQDALNHLYDTPYLQNHPLAVLCSKPGSTGQDLRRILVEAIRAMRPGNGTPAQSPDWRMYRILELRYLEGLTPQLVMERISLAKSQYYREQGRIIEMTIEWLWENYGKEWQLASQVEMMDADAMTSRAALAKAEVMRLCVNADWREVNVGHLLTEVLELIQPLAVEGDVKIEFDRLDMLVAPHADWTLLRQVLLHVITLSLEAAQGGTISISPIDEEKKWGLRICAASSSSTPAVTRLSPMTHTEREGIGLEISHQMMEAMNGILSISMNDNGCWIADLLWQSQSTSVFLVIDDNEYFHELFRRYLSGYQCQVVGATSIERAWELLAEIRPALILLDIMMPKEDGWQLLHTLRESAETSAIPVIICSVLNQPQLARTLGVSGYLHKPITQQALLQELSPWLAERSTP